MTKKKNDLSNKTYLITPSLLNSWGYYMWECEKNVREFESDEKCLEDKIEEARAKAKEDFLNALNRIKTEPNEYMLRGIEFEEECYKGNTPISPIIKDGLFQVVGMKKVVVEDMEFLMYGRLDVLKGGVIYDIKRVSSYHPQKYIGSFQHGFYMDLFPRAKKFKYLPFDDKEKLHEEVYYRGQYPQTTQVIAWFIKWLKENNLLELYKEKWVSKSGR